jgi:prolyl-tRNA synthetase
MAKNAISPKREEDYPNWYLQVIKAANLAEHSPVRGCMVIKPWGYAIWENIQAILNKKFKEKGVDNAYFPLLIPLSFMQKEAKHVDGFAKECAVVTHHRLKADENGELIPDGKLEEPFIIRPTSEMIIGEMFSKWIQSYRDLPMKINQWANVMRWEMRTRLFLRTAEFLWQEGHTVYATKEEAVNDTKEMLDVYANFFEKYLAIPVVKGEKTKRETFPGADKTLCIEAMMQDRKALQAGTTHFLGQNFSSSCNIKFIDENGKEEFGWTTSWGVATRIIGALIMVHSDDDGLILPPKIAKHQVVILPVIHKPELKEKILSYCEKLKEDLDKQSFLGDLISTSIDKRDMRGGEKKWDNIKKGVPLIIEIGPKEVENKKIFYIKRDDLSKKCEPMEYDNFVKNVSSILEDLQKTLYEKAKVFQETHSKNIDTKEEFYKYFTPKNKNKPEIHAGFAYAHFCLDSEIEEKIQKELGVTVRCIPDHLPSEEGKCIFTGKVSKKRVLFAKAY